MDEATSTTLTQAVVSAKEGLTSEATISPINEGLERLHRVLNRLGDSVDRLVVKTQPIRSEYPKEASNEKQVGAGSLMTTAIHELALQAERIEDRLNQTISEIEL